MIDITKMLTLSTAHITKETADKLNIDCKPALPEEYFKHGFCFNLGISVYPKDEYGWFLWVPFSAIEKLPSDLEQCVRLAHRNGCVWLCLDSDGLIDPSLKTYEWED